jgi:phosphatidate phosphatase APP1
MRINRPVAVAAISLTAAALSLPPAFAAGTHQTSLTIRASKSTVAPKHRDHFTLTLRSGRKLVTGEPGSNFVIQERRDRAGAKWQADPVATDSVTESTTSPGHYTFTFTMPATLTKGQKEQVRVKFTGDTANGYAASRSPVVTLTAS